MKNIKKENDYEDDREDFSRVPVSENEEDDESWDIEEDAGAEGNSDFNMVTPSVSSLATRSVSKETLNPNDPLAVYLKEVSRFRLLSPEEEQQMTKELFESGDIEIAKKLVQANLRLVVKIALEYRSAYQNILDLVQEGNIGLMKAVSKYDPTKGAKLSYYASWWIRSYILKFILDNFRLIKIGTTSEQKKLFYNLMREKNRLEQLGIGHSSAEQSKLISENLGVSEKSVHLMEQRLSGQGQELSLDHPVMGSDDSGAPMLLSSTIASEDQSVEDSLAYAQGLNILQDKLKDFMQTLKERDLEIFKKRLLSEVPPSLQKLADEYGVSRERIRQIEERLMGKLKEFMQEHIY